LAIKHLQATQTFEPSEPELRAAIDKASQRARSLERDANEWLRLLRESDAVMFKIDPDGWRAAHAAANNEAISIMDGTHDADPYTEALNALWEETFDDYGERRADAPKQIAACAKPPAKKTHKPKKGGKS
jgi:hypothetical protein